MTPERTGSKQRRREASRAQRLRKKALEYLGAAGPGLVTGASDDDPSGVATYSQVGAKYGPSFLWTAVLTLPLMMGVQEICDRTALATGSGLGEFATKHFGRVGRAVIGALLVILIIANTLNIAADLVAIGSGMNLLKAGPTWLWALLAGGIITLIMWKGTSARISIIFKVLAAALLVYIVVAIMVTKQWERVLDYTFVPHVQFNRTYISLLVAVLGTTISPYLFFWQSADRLEEMRLEPEGGLVASPLRTRSHSHAAPQTASQPSRRLLGHGVLEHRHVLHHRRNRGDTSRTQSRQRPKCCASRQLTQAARGSLRQRDLRYSASSAVVCWRFRCLPLRAPSDSRDS